MLTATGSALVAGSGAKENEVNVGQGGLASKTFRMEAVRAFRMPIGGEMTIVEIGDVVECNGELASFLATSNKAVRTDKPLARGKKPAAAVEHKSSEKAAK